MKIRFMGLVCHVHQKEAGNGEDIAVLMKEEKHLPRLRVRRGYVFGEHQDEPAILCEDLSGAVVRFSLGSGVANRDGLVGIPGLKQQGGNGTALHPHVGARDTSGNLRSFIILPEGSYDVEDRFETLGTFVGGTPSCVARTVTYDIPVPANVTKVTVSGLQGGGTIELKPEAVFSITNLEDVRLGDPHFRLYENMFADSVTIADIDELKDERCDSGTEEYFYETCTNEPFKNVGVECTNSQYP
jgi:hypothetical protein